MSITIRLSLSGKKGQPKYRVVVCETRSKRNGKFSDLIGSYDPNVKPPVFILDQKKYNDWKNKGAITSTGLLKILKNSDEKAD